MSVASESKANQTLPKPSNTLRMFLVLGIFLALWTDLIHQLSYEWSSNEQYGFGWFAPVLALGLLLRRWLTRPAPGLINTKAPHFWIGTSILLLALALLPLRVISEANPDWPLICWPLALVVVGLTLFAFYFAGGLRWVRHFAFPICFMLVAVQWPWRIEHPLTQGLMRIVASITAESAVWLGIPAIEQGNLIELTNGAVGVEDACSGIRSLQANLMGALFLGELYRLGWMRRFLLLMGGMALAFCLNVARTLILTWKAASGGVPALETYHAPAGLVIVVVCFLCLWGLSLLLAKKFALENARPSFPPKLMPRSFVCVMSVCTLAVIFGTESWFKYHERQRVPPIDWNVYFPAGKTVVSEINMARYKDTLAFDIGSGASWQDNNIQWSVYYCRWLPGRPVSAMHARGHRPEICLPAGGLPLKEDLGIEKFRVGEINLPFETYIFEKSGQRVFVFFCLWEDGNEHLPLKGWRTSEARLETAWLGVRRMGQRTMEILLSGCANLEEARTAVQEKLPDMIRLQNHPVLSPG